MRLAPANQLAQPLFERHLGDKADLGGGALRAADAVAHQRRLAARRILDRLVRAGQPQQHLGQFLERGALARADIVKAVDDIGAHRAEVRAAAILDGDKIEGFAAVAQNGGALAAIDRVEHLHDDSDIGAAIILPRPIDVHIAQAHDIEPVAVVKGTRHRFAGDFGRAIEILVVEGVILGHRLLDGVAVDRRGG